MKRLLTLCMIAISILSFGQNDAERCKDIEPAYLQR